jgi:GDPmannose 4,6-dehydratase
MWLMMQRDCTEDFVLATGEAHSVREFVELAFAEMGCGIAWQGRGRDETGVDAVTGRTLVKVDARYFRPTEVETLLGDAGKAWKSIFSRLTSKAQKWMFSRGSI